MVLGRYFGRETITKIHFTPDNRILPEEINPNDNENVRVSLFNFSTYSDEHINKSVRGYQNPGCDRVKISRYFVEKDTTNMDLGCPS